MLRRKKASTRCHSTAFVRPHQALEAYIHENWLTGLGYTLAKESKIIKKSQYTYMSPLCADALANLIKTKDCSVGVPRNIIAHEKFEVHWLRALSIAVGLCRSYPI